MLTEDWMMRQVDALARSIAYLVFQKESTGYVPAGAIPTTGVIWSWRWTSMPGSTT